ncbi:MAG: S-layer homology domain-containing protein [Firmicutes bacterium]|nr:S-layer homology domain-containing protein [Bacillota bacterium]
MKRWALGWTLMMLLAWTGIPAAAGLADVPPDHWAYEAVRELVDRGYLDIADDGTFRGEEPVDRFTVAAVVGRLLEDIEAGRIQIREGADAELIRQLEQEFRAELVAWHAERDELQSSYAQTQRAVAVVDEQLNRVLRDLELLESELNSLRDAEAAARAELTAVLEAMDAQFAQELATRDALLDEHEERMDGQDESLAELHARLVQTSEDLTQRLDALQAALEQALEQHGITLEEEFGQRLGEHRTALEALETDVSGLAADLTALDERVNGLREDLDAVKEQLAALTVRVDDDVQRLANLMNEQAAAIALRLGQLESAVNERLDAQVSDLSGELATLRADAADLAAALEQLEETVQARGLAAQTADEELRRFLAAHQERLSDQEARLNEVRAQVEAVEEQAAQEGQRLDSQISALHDLLASLEAELAALREESERRSAALVEGDAQVLQDVQSLRQEVQALRRRQDALEGRVLANEAAINLLREDFDSALAESRSERGAIRQELSEIQAAIRDIQGLLGTSEEQIANLADRLRREMETQLNLSIAREQRLERELEELKSEFASYRSRAENEIGSLRGTGTLAAGAAVLAILLGLSR